jgi:metal-responsive CopG/Arc/MetJ family transcriptional regulator
MFSSQRKIKLDAALYDRLAVAAQEQGYASTEEMIVHVLERAVSQQKQDQAAAEQQLRGLGYLE